jgi:hypothetical protein
LASKPKLVSIEGGESQRDPLDVNNRLYKQIARLLDQLEKQDLLDENGVTIPQRINALIAVGRIQIMFANLRKAQNVESGATGSAVRKYASAFSRANATRRGAINTRADDSFADGFGGDDGGDGDDAA